MQLSRQINLGTLLLLLFVSASMSNAKYDTHAQDVDNSSFIIVGI